ncbi:SdpI family protein [Alkalihalobacillus sp. FSL R5-0424]
MKFFPVYMAFFTLISSGWLLASGNIPMTISTWIGLLVFPVLIIIMYPINTLIFKAYRGLTDNTFKYETAFQNLISIFLTTLHVPILLSIAGVNIQVGLVTGVSIGILMIGLGIMLPKTKRNVLFGARTKWSLKDDEVWRKTNQYAGKLFIWFGVIIMAIGFVSFISIGLFASMLTLVFAILMILIEIYSYKLYKSMQLIKKEI